MFYLGSFYSYFPDISQGHPGMILKLVCICCFWSKRRETQVKSNGNTLGEILSFRHYVGSTKISRYTYSRSLNPLARQYLPASSQALLVAGTAGWSSMGSPARSPMPTGDALMMPTSRFSKKEKLSSRSGKKIFISHYLPIYVK